MTTSIWPTVHAERRALADDLGGLTAEQWETPSLCAGWSVRDVLAHMTATALISAPAFFPKFVRAGFSLSRMQANDLARERGASGAEALARFERVVTSSKHPPGPTATWLGEAIVHAEDIRRPLGIPHAYPVDALVRVADAYKGSNLVIGAKTRIAGLRLRATDTDWAHGSGPEVAGPMLALLLAMAGRSAASADLEGEGVAALTARLTTTG
jgi:uncharacterized protein (TIGR03083 family)